MGKISRRNAAIAAFFLFCAFCVVIVLFLLSGSTQVEVLPSVQVLDDPQERYLPLVFEEQNGSAVLVCSGAENTVLLRLDGVTGQIQLQDAITSLSPWAALRGGSLFVLESENDSTLLVTYDVETFEELSHRSLPLLPDKLLQFDCDSGGTVYCTLSDSPAVLRILSPDETEVTREFAAPVEYLETAEDGSLLVFAGEKLFYARQGNFQEIPCLAPPCKRLNDTLSVDRDGIVSVIAFDETGAFLSPLFRCSEQFSDAFSFCLDGEKCLILSNGSTVLRYDLEGQSRGSCHLTSAPLAICSAGALLLERNELSYSAFAFSEEELPFETPLPPENSQSSEEFPSEEPPLEIEGQYIVMPVGSTVAELREYFKPEAVKICDLAGRQITQGTLATGMTAGDWIIVIEGDCNGTGTVNSADLRAALTLFLESPLVTDANSRAADLNRSGEIDTQDLLLLSRRLGK